MWADDDQLLSCAASLVDDGLARRVPDGLSLPATA